jgi:hypothetical protein
VFVIVMGSKTYGQHTDETIIFKCGKGCRWLVETK